MKKTTKPNRTPVQTKFKQRLIFKIIHAILVGVPLIAGIDKYFNKITDWERYVSPALKPFVPMSAKNAMRCAGVVEVAIGVTTMKRPRIGSGLFSLLMVGIILNLLTMRKQLHIASLDFCMAIFSLSFAALLPDTEDM